MVCLNEKYISRSEQTPGNGFHSRDKNVTKLWRYLKPYKDDNSDIYSHHQCIVYNVNPLSQKFMKYCLNITHHVCKTGSRRLKLLNVSAITANTWSLVVYLSESVKICFFLKTLLKVLFLIVCWLCDLSRILEKVYL